MTKEERTNIERYHSALIQYERMEAEGIISHEDLLKLESRLAEKYCINFVDIYRKHELINRRIVR